MLSKMTRQQTFIRLVTDTERLIEYIVETTLDMGFCRSDCTSDDDDEPVCEGERLRACIRRWLNETVLVDIDEDTGEGKRPFPVGTGTDGEAADNE